MIETIMGAGIFLILLWANICNEKTRRQRHELVNAASRKASSMIEHGQLEWKTAWIPYEAVSYEAHFWRLLTFRDPNKLYYAIVEGPKE